MVSFLSLPGEIRREIYRLCRESRFVAREYGSGTYNYYTFGRCPILLVNRQIRQEAMADIYGRETARIFVDSTSEINFGPLKSAVKYVRKVIISFSMCKVLLYQYWSIDWNESQTRESRLRILNGNIEKLSLWLKDAKALRYLELQCDERSVLIHHIYLVGSRARLLMTLSYHRAWDDVVALQGILLGIIKPLCHSPYRIEIVKGPISVQTNYGIPSWISEKAFSNVVDAIIHIRKKNKDLALNAFAAKKSLNSS